MQETININLICPILDKGYYGYLSRLVANSLTSNSLFSLNILNVDMSEISYNYEQSEVSKFVPFLVSKAIYPSLDIVILPHSFLERINLQEIISKSSYCMVFSEWTSDLIPLSQVEMLKKVSCLFTTSSYSRDIYKKYGIKAGILNLSSEESNLVISKNKLERFLYIKPLQKNSKEDTVLEAFKEEFFPSENIKLSILFPNLDSNEILKKEILEKYSNLDESVEVVTKNFDSLKELDEFISNYDSVIYTPEENESSFIPLRVSFIGLPMILSSIPSVKDIFKSYSLLTNFVPGTIFNEVNSEISEKSCFLINKDILKQHMRNLFENYQKELDIATKLKKNISESLNIDKYSKELSDFLFYLWKFYGN